MPRILAPWPATAAERKKKPLPEGTLKYTSMALRGYDRWREDEPEMVSFDTETTGLTYFDRPFCVTATWRRPSGELTNHYFELGEPSVNDVLAEMLQVQHMRRVTVYHNAKFDLQKLIVYGLLARNWLDPARIHDTEAVAHLLDEHQIKKLKPLAKKYLGEETREAEVVKVVKRTLKLTADDGYDRLPRIILMRYALKDTEYTLRLFEALYPQLVAQGDDLLSLYHLEQKLTLTLLDMEAGGFKADLDYLTTTAKEYGTKVMQAERSLSEAVGKPIGDDPAKGEFNPGSNPQILALLTMRGHPLANVDKEALATVDDPIVDALLEYRSLSKIRNTYLVPAIKEQRDGIIHPNFRQHAARTGRMSSGAAEE